MAFDFNCKAPRFDTVWLVCTVCGQRQERLTTTSAKRLPPCSECNGKTEKEGTDHHG